MAARVLQNLTGDRAYVPTLEQANECRTQTEFRASRTSDGEPGPMSFGINQAIITANPAPSDPSAGLYCGVSGQGSDGSFDDEVSFGEGGTGVRGIGGSGEPFAGDSAQPTGVGGVGVLGLGGDGVAKLPDKVAIATNARPGPGVFGKGGTDLLKRAAPVGPGVVGVCSIPTTSFSSHPAVILGGSCGVVGAGREVDAPDAEMGAGAVGYGGYNLPSHRSSVGRSGPEWSASAAIFFKSPGRSRSDNSRGGFTTMREFRAGPTFSPGFEVCPRLGKESRESLRSRAESLVSPRREAAYAACRRR